MFFQDPMPPKDTANNSLRIVRAPARGATSWIISSTKIVGTRNHFYNGRTCPCVAGDCPPCNAGMPWRWAGYLSVWNPTSNERAVLELPAAAGQAVHDFIKGHGYLRKALIGLTRAGNRSNGRVLATLKPWDAAGREVPDGIDIVKYLCNLWGIALDSTAEGTGRYNGSTAMPVQFKGDRNRSGTPPTS